MPVAEKHGLIGDIDQRVFELAILHAAAGHSVAINVSAESISEPGPFRHVAAQLAALGINPELIIFEITETARVRNEGVAQVFIERIRRLGCGVALDDFGTGYGSFRYLKHLPVNVRRQRLTAQLFQRLDVKELRQVCCFDRVSFSVQATEEQT